MAILVLGATGFVGQALVEALSNDAGAGDEVRLASRRAAPKGTDPRRRTVQCDLTDPGTLPAALEGADCVYYLVHSMGPGGGDFRSVERACAENLARAAESRGCRRIVYLGGVAPQGAPSEHLASRLAVGAILRSGAVPAVELRSAMIVGHGSTSWKIVRDLSMRLPVMILPRWLESRSRPVSIADVVAALRAARSLPLDRSAWFDIPGPETLSAREILQRVAALRGRHIPMVRVPVLTPNLSALWLKLVSGADYAVARELVLGLGADLLPRDARFWRLAGHETLQSFDEAAEIALAAEERSAAARAGRRRVDRAAAAIRGARPLLRR